jgi:membrane protein required for colicin V production
LNYFDIVIICFLSFAFIRGFFKGFFNEIASFFGFFIGLIGAAMFTEQVSELIFKFINIDLKVLNIISFILLFISITISFSLIGKSLTKLIKFASLSLINRLFGGVFSSGKYLVVFSFFVLLLDYLNNFFSINLIPQETLNSSKVYNILQSIGDSLLFLLDNQMMFTL